ncbi:membrane protein DedA with SNARE-associated domain [Kribbella voronezhensis]|uniref:Membrane protein DedA with SNARE-associated domain n=1 Tax=Kribbella voronezhensis TaxID=2512212 RepID=A0A4V3FJ09_9ACTN|nr:DedA family protein [Kribbella voronezhensis]TDU84453.1 membrane protein DedA with SNARE-associated domain [Kribbella voronezhensis]
MNTIFDWLAGLPAWLVITVVVLLPALEASTFLGLVVPGETAVIVGGVVAHAGGLPLWAVMVAAGIGAIAGDQVGFLVGRRFGASLLGRLPRRLRRPEHIERALALIARRGAFAVVLGRWTAAFRALVPGIAGMSRMRRMTFTVANVIGGAVWAVLVAGGGYLAGASYRVLEQSLGLVSGLLLAAFVAAIVSTVVVYRRRHRRLAGR